MTARPEPDDDLSAITGERRQLINLAYRLLGSVTEAEDVLQETYARWYAMSREQRDAIEVQGAWLNRVASRICLDVLGSARVRRESYVGEWIPEPVPADAQWISAGWTGGADPADRVTLDESISVAFLVVLESMTPAQRVTFILHDVFRYPFDEVAEIVGRTPAACRQLATSARRSIRAAAPDSAPGTARQAEIVREFRRAWEAKDVKAIVGLLDPDAVATGDGGGIVQATLEPVVGSEQVARSFVAIAEMVSGLRMVEREVNGRPGVVIEEHGVVGTVMAFDFSGDRIKRIWAVRNPRKLRSWTAG